MKIIISTSLFLFLVISTYAQSPVGVGIYQTDLDKYKILDSAVYKFAYKLIYVPDSTKVGATMENQLILQIGNKISRFYSTDYFRKAEKSKIQMNADISQMLMPGHGLNGTEIFKDNTTKKESVTTRVAGTRDIYTYEENIPELKWKITSEMSTILSYQCLKAITTFNGRIYEAWFTIAIPISNGPWKLGGLPGMILKVSDIQKHFTFICTGIEVLKVKEPIRKYDGKYTTLSRKDINKLIRNLHEQAVQTYEGMGLKYIGDKPIPKRPYNPIERE